MFTHDYYKMMFTDMKNRAITAIVLANAEKHYDDIISTFKTAKRLAKRYPLSQLSYALRMHTSQTVMQETIDQYAENIKATLPSYSITHTNINDVLNKTIDINIEDIKKITYTKDDKYLSLPWAVDVYAENDKIRKTYYISSTNYIFSGVAGTAQNTVVNAKLLQLCPAIELMLNAVQIARRENRKKLQGIVNSGNKTSDNTIAITVDTFGITNQTNIGAKTAQTIENTIQAIQSAKTKTAQTIDITTKQKCYSVNDDISTTIPKKLYDRDITLSSVFAYVVGNMGIMSENELITNVYNRLNVDDTECENMVNIAITVLSEYGVNGNGIRKAKNAINSYLYDEIKTAKNTTDKTVKSFIDHNGEENTTNLIDLTIFKQWAGNSRDNCLPSQIEKQIAEITADALNNLRLTERISVMLYGALKSLYYAKGGNTGKKEGGFRDIAENLNNYFSVDQLTALYNYDGKINKTNYQYTLSSIQRAVNKAKENISKLLTDDIKAYLNFKNN